MVITKFLSVFLVILLGYVFAKIAKPNTKQLAFLSKFLLWVFVPSLVISASYDLRNNWVESVGVAKVVGLTFVIQLSLIGMYLLFRKKTNKDHKKLLIVSALLMNCGYMGIPVSEAIGGDPLKILTIYYSVVYMPVIAIISEMVFSKNGLKNYLKNIYKEIYLIAVFIGVFLSYIPKESALNIIPEMFIKLGDMAPSLMLMLIGIQIASIKDKICWEAVEASAVRFVIGGVVVVVLLSFFGWSALERNLIIVESMMPLAILPLLIARKNNHEIKGFQSTIILSTAVYMVIYVFTIIYLK